MTHSFYRPLLLATLIVAVFGFVAAGFSPTFPLAAICSSEDCKEARQWLSFAVTVSVVIGGLYQYWQAQRWKRSEWIAETTKAFFDDKKVMNALYMMDWNSRRLPLLLEASESGKAYFDYKAELLRTALYSKSTIPKNASGLDRAFSEEELAIRDCFDRLLDQLERFEVFIRSGLVTYSALRPYLQYWFELIGNPRYGRKSPDLIYRLWSYIADYGFSGVQDLADRFGYDIRRPPIVRDAYQAPNKPLQSTTSEETSDEVGPSFSER